MSEPDYPSRSLDRVMVRLPDGMRERLKQAAAESGRSANAEIVSRLEQSLDGAFLDLSGIGFVAIVKRLEATVEANESLLFSIRDELPGIETVMLEKGLSRKEAIRLMVTDWLRQNGYLTP